MSFLSSGAGGDPTALVFNSLIAKTQNVVADSTPSTTYTGTVAIPTLNVTGKIENTTGAVVVDDDLEVTGKLGAAKSIKAFTVANRNLSLLDANNNGLPGTDPNADQTPTLFMGDTIMESQLLIDRKLRPSDVFDLFGPALQIKNRFQPPYYLSDGTVKPALTLSQIGHDASSLSMNLYKYYGPGHFQNSFTIDSMSNFDSVTPAFKLSMRTKSLITTPSVLQNSITTSGNVGTITNVNYYTDTLKSGRPQVGQTVTISATPSTLNVTNALILSVTPVSSSTGTAHTITYEFNSTAGNLTSTAVQYVYYGPGISATGSTGTVKFSPGPMPLVGQKIKILAQPASLNIDNALIESVTLGSTPSLTFTYSSPFTNPTSATVITSVDLLTGTVGTNTSYGSLGNLGIHTQAPEAPLDVTGDVVFREVTTNKPLLSTKTVPGESVTCNMYVNDPFSEVQFPFIDFDVKNEVLKINSRVTNTDMVRFDSEAGVTTWLNPDDTKVIDIQALEPPSHFTFYQSDGETPLFKCDQSNNSVTLSGTVNLPVGTIPAPTKTVMAMRTTTSHQITDSYLWQDFVPHPRFPVADTTTVSTFSEGLYMADSTLRVYWNAGDSSFSGTGTDPIWVNFVCNATGHIENATGPTEVHWQIEFPDYSYPVQGYLSVVENGKFNIVINTPIYLDMDDISRWGVRIYRDQGDLFIDGAEIFVSSM